MPTQVDDSGLAFEAAYLATQAVTISVHTADPGPTGSNNELSTGAGRNYRRHTEPAGDWTATGAINDNDDSIDVFTPSAADAGTTCRYIGIRFGNTWYGRIRLQNPVVLIAGSPFRIPPGALDMMKTR